MIFILENKATCNTLYTLNQQHIIVLTPLLCNLDCSTTTSRGCFFRWRALDLRADVLLKQTNVNLLFCEFEFRSAYCLNGYDICVSLCVCVCVCVCVCMCVCIGWTVQKVVTHSASSSVLWERATGELASAPAALLHTNGFLMVSHSWHTLLCWGQAELLREGKAHFLILNTHCHWRECVHVSAHVYVLQVSSDTSVSLRLCVCVYVCWCVCEFAIYVIVCIYVTWDCFCIFLNTASLCVCIHLCVNAKQNLHFVCKWKCLCVCEFVWWFPWFPWKASDP